MRLVNSHGSVSTVPGIPGPAQVEANARYAESRRGDALVRGALGVLRPLELGRGEQLPRIC